LVIDNTYYSVRRLELLSTVLVKWNGNVVQVSNSWLASQNLFNLSRSGLYWEFIEAYVDMSVCTSAFLAGLREHIKIFCEQNADGFTGKFQIIARSIHRPLVVRIALYIEFAYKPANLLRLFDDIGKINVAFSDALKSLGASESGIGVGAVVLGGNHTSTNNNNGSSLSANNNNDGNNHLSHLQVAPGLLNILGKQSVAVAVGL
jgi:hypothetical protein